MVETEVFPEIHTAERAELAVVLASESFRRAPTLARMLDYLCKSRLNGETFVKEYEIATEVLGRHSDFDPQQDGSVRVNLHHLRKKLKHFYETEGADHPLHIALPVGQNLPSFILVASPIETEPDTSADFPQADLVSHGGFTEDHTAMTIAGSGDPILDYAASPVDEVQSPPDAQPPASKLERLRRSLPFLVLMALAIGVGLGVLGYKLADRRRAASAPPPAVVSDAVVRMAAGLSQPYVDNTGRRWEPDAYFTGGAAFSHEPRTITGALDSTIYQTGREGNFSYAIPLPAGVYELHLHFADTGVRGEGFRLMSIAVNDKPVVRSFDVVSDVGGADIATEKIYGGLKPGSDGMLRITFKTVGAAKAFVNAIEIFQGNGAAMRPIRQSTLHSFYFDPRGQEWTPDKWFHGGRVGQLPQTFPGDSLQGIYQMERFGNFSYSIPVIVGHTYTLTLYFQDIWFSHQPPGKITTGMRSFDVFCNGKELIHHLDILQEARAGDTRVTRRFSGLQANSQGLLQLAFTPNQNYAMVNAITVEDEADPTVIP